MTLDMGSSGGTAIGSRGTHGGGAFGIDAEWVTVTGEINMSGGIPGPGAGQGGGGGAGGGIGLAGTHVMVSGSLIADGSDGCVGTSTANDDGGGGGGGRIKIFAQMMIGSPVMSVDSGVGGPYGTAAGGEDGQMGSIFMAPFPYGGADIAYGGTEMGLPAFADSMLLCGGSVTLDAGANQASYSWSTTATTQMITATSAGDYSVTVTDAMGCMHMDTISLTPSPVAPVAITGNAVVCEGQAVTLDAGAGYVSYMWSTGDSSQTTVVGTSQQVIVTTMDSYGCTTADTVDVVVNPAPTPPINDNGTMVSTNTGYSSYQWFMGSNPISGATTETYTYSATGNYWVQVTDANGCVGNSDTLSVVVALDEVLSQEGLQLWPNPTEGQLNLSIQHAGYERLKLEVFDLMGRRVEMREIELEAGENLLKLDMGHLAPGAYIIRMGEKGIRFVKE